ncbi:hypothetical protein Kpho02_05170 [Kitasatospora phosalacinea]|uniref:Uncharacterized protein n=1 Tax=Kitasatospora phosalacinea TaxID=2065 RepID=A0A9W6Q466_9ACTN|nr:hypothetical protein [Kitasatospora phosalacinea]GLW68218.1 hypothetical protein Kpho02_05170 [Kitasatospora phosalacinea]
MTSTKHPGLIGLEVEISQQDTDTPRAVYLLPDELAEAELTMARLREYSATIRRSATANTDRPTTSRTGA